MFPLNNVFRNMNLTVTCAILAFCVDYNKKENQSWLVFLQHVYLDEM